MYPFRRILIPTDFSTASEWAFDDAVRIAGMTGAEVIILHIRMTWERHPDELRFPADPRLYEYAEQHELARLRDRVRRSNASVSTRLAVKQGPEAGKEILKFVADEDIDLVVIATHGRHHVAHLLIGSTTMSLVNDPPAPVLAIRYGTRKRTGTMKKIVVPVHPRQTSPAALELAAAITASHGGELHLLTVCEEKEVAAAESSLRDLAGRIPNARQTIIRGTEVEREIIRYAAKTDADVIFINARQQLTEKKINIVQHAATPVMVVPHRPE
ncbi:MAG TPA: universal stress protein, partial [Thermoanaerobaculia bacterium]|nr:universal stress protein [Thermoanaerobaculia bacterium]